MPNSRRQTPDVGRWTPDFGRSPPLTARRTPVACRRSPEVGSNHRMPIFAVPKNRNFILLPKEFLFQK